MLEASPPFRAGARTGAALTEDAAAAHVAAGAFSTGVPGFVGAEVEWLLRRSTDPSRRIPLARLREAVATARAELRHGRLTVQPGGAIEVSTPPSPGIDECIRRTAEDLAVVREALRAVGLAPMNSALDPFRAPRRIIDSPRYAAMERYFGRAGLAGQWAMSSTAAVRVCLDAGLDDEGPRGYRRRWALAHAIGPVLVAAFANSPLRLGRATGWRSTRQAVWRQLDPGRTGAPGGGDPRQAWARYALDAAVMCVPDADHRAPADGGPVGVFDGVRTVPAQRGRPWAVPRGLTFREWIRGGHSRRPTVDDLDYHLGTLFPPVRPRGHLELRMIDGQPGDAWAVAVAVTAALFGDAKAGDQALAATERLHGGARSSGSWVRAARSGLRDPELAAAALTCFMTAYEALGRQNVSRGVRDLVAWFIEAYVARGRSPADDVLDTVDEFA